MRLTVALLVVLVALAFGAVDDAGRTPVASAHALLVSAEPPVNAALPEAPRELTLRFSEPLERKFSTAGVADQDGNRLDEGVAFDDADGAVMRVRIGTAGPGYIIVSWETVSVVDGHRVTGSYPITILNPDGSAPAVAPPATTGIEGDEPRFGLVVAKFLLLVAGCLLAGALMFMVWVSSAFAGEGGARARRTSEGRSLMTAFVALAVIAVAGGLEVTVQAHNIGSSAGDVLGTRWGERWLLRNACFAVAFAAVLALLLGATWSSGVRRRLATAALAATALAFVAVSSTSHAAAGEGAFWAAAADFVHLLAASVWIGMLAMLAMLFVWARRHVDGGARHTIVATALQRFSIIAAVSLALLLFTGTQSAVIEVGRFDDVIDSGYGRALLLKLFLVLPLLGVAAYNAYVLRPDYLAAATEGAESEALDVSLARQERRFVRLIRTEAALALTVLAVVAVLVQINPTRASASQTGADTFSERKDAEGISVGLLVDPNVPGINTFEVSLSGAVDFVEAVRLEFLDRSGTTSESRLELDAVTPRATYAGQGPFLSKASDWQVRVNLRQSQGRDLSVPFDVVVGGGASAGGRGGAFASPVEWSAARVALVVFGGAVAVAVVLGSLRSSGRQSGYIGWILNRKSRPRTAPDVIDRP